jgi:hypothetical protein
MRKISRASVLFVLLVTSTASAQSTADFVFPTNAWKNGVNQPGGRSYSLILGTNDPDRRWGDWTDGYPPEIAPEFQSTTGEDGGCYAGPGDTHAACDLVGEGVPGGCWGGYDFLDRWTEEWNGVHRLRFARAVRLYGKGETLRVIAGHDQPNAENLHVALGGSIAFVSNPYDQYGEPAAYADEIDNCIWYWMEDSRRYVRMNAAAVNDANCSSGHCINWGAYTNVPINSPMP